MSLRPVMLPIAAVLAGFAPTPVAWAQASRPNIVVIVLDDTGTDFSGIYPEDLTSTPQEFPIAPSLEALAQQGVRFRNVWSAPLCSATRATMLTGRFGFRTGIGGANPVLSLDETIIPEVLSDPSHFGGPSPYAHVAVGKWHVTRWHTPMTAGFGAFHGAFPGNFRLTGTLQYLAENYFDWTKTDEVVAGTTTTTKHYGVYATTDNVNDAIAWVKAREQVTVDPWFVWLAFNAIHTPLQGPPAVLHSQPGVVERQVLPLDAPPETTRAYALAMMEAMDREIGRFLAGDASRGWPGIDLSDTTVIVVGDNGSAYPLDEAINRSAKGEVYEGGVNVPLVVAGSAVASTARGAVSDGLVHTADVFATVLELAGIDPLTVTSAKGEIDSRSLVPYLSEPARTAFPCAGGDPDEVRTCARWSMYTDGVFGINGAKDPKLHDVAIRTRRHKLIRRACENDAHVIEFYDLRAVPNEAIDRLTSGWPLTSSEQNTLDALLAQLDAVTGTPTEAPCPDPG